MQRLLVALTLFAMIAIAVLTAAPLFMNLDGYKEKLADSIQAVTGLHPQINGEVSVSFLPSLSIKVTNVSIPNMQGGMATSLLKVESIYVRSSFNALFMGEVDIKNIELVRPVFELERLEDGSKNWDVITRAMSERNLPQDFHFPELISIKNGTLNYQENNTITTIDYISSDIKSDSAIGPFAIYGNFSSGENVINFEGYTGKLQEGAEAYFDVSSKTMKLDLKGSYNGGENPKIAGSIEGNSSDLGKLAAILFGEKSIFSGIKSDETMTVTGSFELSPQQASFSDIKASSPSIDGVINIKALFGNEENNDLKWDVGINLSKVNIDQLASEKTEEQQASVADKEEKNTEVNYYSSTLKSNNLSDFDFYISPLLSAKFDIKIDEVTYKNEKISNIAIAADMLNGKAHIGSFSADLPGDSTIGLSGDITNNGTRPLLVGELKSSGRNFRDIVTWVWPDFAFIPENKMREYLFKSKINMTPQNINFSEIYLSFDDSLLTGELYVRPKTAIPTVQAHLNIDRFDFDSYDFTKSIYEKSYDFFSTVATKDLMTSPLRMLNVKYELSIEAKDLTFNNNNIQNSLVSLDISQGKFDLHRLSIESDKASFDATILADILATPPSLNIAVKSGKLDTAFIIPAGAKKESQPEIKGDNWIWSKEPFNLGGIDRFSGSVNLYFDRLMHDKMALDKLTLQGIFTKQVLQLQKAEAGLFGGRAVLKGSVGINESHPSMAISVLLQNIDIAPLEDFLIDKSDIEGKLFFSGVIKTIGESPSDWMLALDTEGKMAGRYVKFKNFDLEYIIANSRNLYSVIDMNNIVNKAMNSGETIFDSIDGNIETAKGILSARDFEIATKNSRGLFAGNMSLGNFMMKGLAKFGYRPERSKAVTLKLNLDGALNNLKKVMDTGELESYIVAKGKR